jgi:hypothetical protein
MQSELIATAHDGVEDAAQYRDVKLVVDTSGLVAPLLAPGSPGPARLVKA